MELNEHIIGDIGELVFENSELSKCDWDSVSLVFEIKNENVVNSGFWYKGDVATFISLPANDDLTQLNQLYLEMKEMMEFEPEFKLLKMLIQIEKVTLALNVDFEYEDNMKWLVDPLDEKSAIEIRI